MVQTTPNHVKVNVDASFDADSLRGTTGVIRDANGKFVAVCNHKLDFVQDVLAAEAHALKRELLLVQSLRCNRVIFASDSMDVVETMINGAHSHGVAAAIFYDCYHLSTEFVKIEFVHEPRERNIVAHELASLAKFSNQSVWLVDPPPSLIPLIVSDVTLFDI